MATLVAANLSINVNAAEKTARCIVTCKAVFTPFELKEMKEGLKFVMHCNLWGEDLGIGNWLNPDDFIFSYGSKFFPDATPTASETATFDATLGTSLLDEDWGTDEVYGLVTLRNLYTNNTVKRKTNVIVRNF
jgi:hypothetical protein